uniref:Uncharacterized protein n=1 Tax=Clytia hemisphaerica TaxID=252671 RepID=A0A7M6DMY0_9CNID
MLLNFTRFIDSLDKKRTLLPLLVWKKRFEMSVLHYELLTKNLLAGGALSELEKTVVEDIFRLSDELEEMLLNGPNSRIFASIYNEFDNFIEKVMLFSNKLMKTHFPANMIPIKQQAKHAQIRLARNKLAKEISQVDDDISVHTTTIKEPVSSINSQYEKQEDEFQKYDDNEKLLRALGKVLSLIGDDISAHTSTNRLDLSPCSQYESQAAQTEQQGVESLPLPDADAYKACIAIVYHTLKVIFFML